MWDILQIVCFYFGVFPLGWIINTFFGWCPEFQLEGSSKVSELADNWKRHLSFDTVTLLAIGEKCKHLELLWRGDVSVIWEPSLWTQWRSHRSAALSSLSQTSVDGQKNHLGLSVVSSQEEATICNNCKELTMFAYHLWELRGNVVSSLGWPVQAKVLPYFHVQSVLLIVYWFWLKFHPLQPDRRLLFSRCQIKLSDGEHFLRDSNEKFTFVWKLREVLQTSVSLKWSCLQIPQPNIQCFERAKCWVYSKIAQICLGIFKSWNIKKELASCDITPPVWLWAAHGHSNIIKSPCLHTSPTHTQISPTHTQTSPTHPDLTQTHRPHPPTHTSPTHTDLTHPHRSHPPTQISPTHTDLTCPHRPHPTHTHRSHSPTQISLTHTDLTHPLTHTDLTHPHRPHPPSSDPLTFSLRNLVSPSPHATQHNEPIQFFVTQTGTRTPLLLRMLCQHADVYQQSSRFDGNMQRDTDRDTYQHTRRHTHTYIYAHTQAHTHTHTHTHKVNRAAVHTLTSNI